MNEFLGGKHVFIISRLDASEAAVFVYQQPVFYVINSAIMPDSPGLLSTTAWSLTGPDRNQFGSLTN